MCFNRPLPAVDTYIKLPHSSQKTNWSRNTKQRWHSQIYDNCTHCWKFPRGLSQSKIGGREVPSSACTFIALRMAYIILGKQSNLDTIVETRLENLKPFPALIPHELLNMFCTAIIDGNELHELANNARQKDTDTFNIPDAIISMSGVLHEIDFMIYEGHAWIDLYNVLKNVSENGAVQKIDRLCFILIAMERAILLVLERKTNSIFVFDSHGHDRGILGPFISATKFRNLLHFSVHLFTVFFPDLVSRGLPQKFEISCIQLNNPNKITEKIFPRKIKLLTQKITP